MPKESDSRREVAFIMSPGANQSLDRRIMIPKRIPNTPVMAKIIHFMYCVEISFRSFDVGWRTFVNAIMLHPRISVVRAVARAWMTCWESKIMANSVAQAFPRR